MRAEIMSIGTELLLGDILNTNAQYLARELANLGIDIFHQSVVGDNGQRIKEGYRAAFDRADLVIATGGLGPTKDDLTKEMASEYFGKELVLDHDSLREIESFFIARNKNMPESNKKQALYPQGSIILPNSKGTAPGCIIAENNKILVLLPGPPKEMIPMFANHVVPYLKKFQDGVLVSKVVRLTGIGESHMEERIKDIIEGQSNPTIAPYAKEGDVTLRITAKAPNNEEAQKIINPVLEEIKGRLGEHIYGYDDTTLEEAVGKLLVDRGLTISVAESCTGGLLASRLINYPGISSVFMEGMITYSNDSKTSRLGVSIETLNNHGAVSEETAKEMAEGVARVASTDIGLSITGIAGPGGGTEEKPVGLIYLGLYLKGSTITKKINLSGDRQKIRKLTVITALNWLRREILKNTP